MESNSGQFITVVSGLPRSGTSLMMQMLAAGGMTLLTDGARPPDGANPRGYFEYAAAKRLATDNCWLAEAQGKVIKIIAQLVVYLPPQFDYRIIMMQRSIDEVISSQAEMLRLLERTPATVDSSVLASTFERQRRAALEFAKSQPNMRLATVDYPQVIQRPARVIELLAAFLERPCLNFQAMAGVVDPSLYRTRSPQGTSRPQALFGNQGP